MSTGILFHTEVAHHHSTPSPQVALERRAVEAASERKNMIDQ